MGFLSRVKSLFIEFGVDTKAIREGYRKLVGRTKEAEEEIGGTSRKLDNFGAKLKKVFIGGAIALGLKSITSAAIDAQEIASKFGTIFKDESDKANAAMLELSKGYGLAKTTSMELLGATGDLLTGLGMNQKTALDLSVQTQKLAVDLASFTNFSGGAEGASMALTKALLGERDMIKNLGISILETDVKQRLAEKGMDKLTGTALKAARAQVTLELATEQSKNAIGDYARTSDSAANVIRTIGERFKDFQVELGNTLVQNENFNSALGMTKDLFESESFKNSIASIVGLLTKFLANIVGIIPGLIELVNRGKKLQNQFAAQAVDFEKSFDTIYKGLQKAGVGFDTLNKAISDLPDGEKIDKLGERQAKLNEKIKTLTEITGKAGKSSLVYIQAQSELEKKTKELNKVTAERNYLLSSGIQHIVKNHKEYGITTEQVEKLRKALRGEVEEKIKVAAATKATTDSEKKGNEEKKKTKQILLDIAKLRKIEIDLAPWLGEFGEIEEENRRKTKEAADAIEKKRRELEKLLEKQKYYNDALDSLSELTFIPEELARGFHDLKEIFSAIIERNYVNAISSGLKAISKLSYVPDKLAIAFEGMGGAIKNIASGNYFGAIATGLTTLGSLFGKDGITGQIEYATEALRQFGITGEEAIQNFSDELAQMFDNMTIGDAMDSFGKNWEQTLDEMEKKAEETAKGTAEWFEKSFGGTGDLADFLSGGAKTQDEFNSQVDITLGLFANMLKSGASITEVLSAMGDSFDKLIKSQEENKFMGDETFEALKQFRTLIKDNEGLVKSVEGFNKVLSLTAELGDLNQKQLDSYSTSALSQYDKLIKAGFSQNQALTMLAPALKTLKEQAEEYGLTLDDNTKKLIEQGENAGVFDDMADPLDKIADILTGIFELLGGSSEKIGEFSRELEGAAAAAGKATGNAATAGVQESLSKVGIFDFNLGASIPAKLELDTTQMQQILKKEGEKDLRVEVIEGPRNQNNYFQPKTIDAREMEKAMKENPKGFADIVRSYM